MARGQETIEYSDDITRARLPVVRSQETSFYNTDDVIAAASTDVIQDRIDVVDELPSVRLRVVELEMFKCHRGCLLKKNNINATVDDDDDEETSGHQVEQARVNHYRKIIFYPPKPTNFLLFLFIFILY